MIDTENIEVCYGERKVLDNISMHAEKGFTGIIGPNGSGKTTLLRSISRVLKPKGGVILLDKRDVYSLASKDVAKNMAVVPQDSQIRFGFTVSEVVLMGRSPHLGRFEREGVRDMEIAKKAMKLTNTLHLADRCITQISGGERQRVVIARALAQQPRILLLDEPTSNLDINYQTEILDCIRELSKELTVIAVFHDLNLAARYCDRLILMDAGRVATCGKPEEVLTPERIESVYGIKVIVKQDSGRLLIYPKRKIPKGRKGRVHVICGAGTATFLMNDLVNHGYEVTAGVLNENDTDWSTAKALNIEVVAEKPFSHITNQKHRQNIEFIKQADFVVLTSIPYGRGNIHNLEAALEAAKNKIRVVAIEGSEIKDRDFSGGKASMLYSQLKANGPRVVRDYNEALEVIGEKCG
jgi:iron complex transport system ATP-binding protein